MSVNYSANQETWAVIGNSYNVEIVTIPMGGNLTDETDRPIELFFDYETALARARDFNSIYGIPELNDDREPLPDDNNT